jgi:cyclopropane fatty-acyl-phospholipid synthase-like methyltransferase|tara:strand:- start:1365 stop:2027 length:663 start_codon:yes stop_codon:yes gene_type:complete
MTETSAELNKQYWDAFYQTNHRHTPSQFCACILTEIEPATVVVELGSGNGRDSHYFASQGHTTAAMDLSKEAIKSCEDHARSRDIEHSAFFQGDITRRESLDKIIAYARKSAMGNDIVFYSRFVMHSLDDDQELAFMKGVSEGMQPGEIIYFEFRSKGDAALMKHYGGHYRRYVDTENFIGLLTKEFGFDIEYSFTGNGMAKYREEDPCVSRVFARKTGY